jgi:hypothetical protein
LYQSYAPNQAGNWTPTMGDTGFQEQIGLLPKWDALYVTSGGDARAYRSVIANAKALNSYPILWNDSVTKVPLRPSDRPTWSPDGPGAGGGTGLGTGSLSWDIAHHGSGGYLAYLITGDYFYLETMAGQAATAYLLAGPTDWTANPAGPNYGTSRYINGQTRGYAWSMRTLSQYAGIAPAGDPVASDYAALLSSNITHLKSLKDTVSPAGSGYVYEYNASLYGTGLVAPWQQHFFIQSLGMGSDLEPLGDMSAYYSIRDYMYRGVIGILGDSTGYCFTQAGAYNVKSNDGTSNQPNYWYKTWGQVYTGTYTTPAGCSNTLGGTSGGDPSVGNIGYWGNLIPAIAYAVDHGASGGAAAWARLTGATNWTTVLQSGFDKVPNWGVIPRSGASSSPSSDTSPDGFGFVSQTNVPLNTTVTSNAITVGGINAAAPISIAGGTYSINGGAYTSTASTVTNGSTVTVRLTSSASNGTPTCATLTIGGVTGQFCATTAAATADTTPDTFGFASKKDVPLKSLVTSATITPTGYNAYAPISIAGGAYSVNGGAFVTAAGTINPGQSVAVQQTSSASYGAITTTILTIGGISGTFTATTLVQDTTPDAFAFASQSGVSVNTTVTSNAITVSGINAAAPISVTGGTYGINGGAYTSSASTVTNGSTVTVRLTSSAANGTPTCATLAIGGVTGQFCATTAAAIADTTPDAFGFGAQTNVGLIVPLTSNTVTPAGYSAQAPISIAGGSYSVNGGAFVSVAGMINPGQTVAVRQTSSSNFGTSTTATLTIGGVSGSFTVTTLAQDTTPAAFSFTRQTGVALNSTVTSNAITVTGINAAAPISITGGAYAINGGAYTSGASTVTNGSTVTVRLTSAASNGTPACAVLTIGGVGGQFCATTVAAAADTTPDAFSFAAQSGVPLSTSVTSNAITVSGINAAAPISIVGGTYSINGGAYVSNASTITNGGTVSVRLTSSASNATPTCATLTIGGVAGKFCATTAATSSDTTPDSFSFTAKTGVPLNTSVTSNAITVTGINAPAPISVSTGAYSVNGGAYTSNAATVSNGNTVTLRITSAASYGTQTCATLKIGTMAAQFCATTLSANSTVSFHAKGRGSGSVSSGTAGGTCTSSCTATVPSGSSFTLSATPSPGSVFTGWLGACTGAGNCKISVRGPVEVSATFAISSPDGLLLDVDGNGAINDPTDGALILRYLGDITGPALTEGLIGPNAQVTTPSAITDYLTDIEPLLDIDGDGIVDPATDGELLSRYLRGVRKGTLTSGPVVGQGATRTSWKEIEAQIVLLLKTIKP